MNSGRCYPEKLRVGLPGFAVLLVLLIQVSLLAQEKSSSFRIEYHRDRYQGKFKNNQEFKNLFRNLDTKFRTAIERITKTLKVRPPEGSVVHVYLKNYGSDWKIPAQIETVSNNEQKLTLMPEYFVSRRLQLSSTLLHEAVHVVLRLYLGMNLYVNIPEWFQEGFAVYLAEEGELHIRSELANKESPKKLLSNLSDSVSFEDYPYCYLAVKFMEEKQGKKLGASFVKRLKSDLENGIRVRKTIERLLGLSWKEFKKKVDSFARKQLDTYTGGQKEYQKGVDLYLNDRLKRAEGKLRSVFENHPDSPFAGKALYYLGKVIYQRQNYVNSAETFQSFVRDYSYSGLVDEGYLYMGLSQFGAGQYEQAVITLEKMTSYFPYSSQWDRGRYFYARSLEEVDHKMNPVEVYESLLEDSRLTDRYRKKAKKRLKKLK